MELPICKGKWSERNQHVNKSESFNNETETRGEGENKLKKLLIYLGRILELRGFYNYFYVLFRKYNFISIVL